MKTSLTENKFIISLLIILAILFLHYTTLLRPIERGVSILLSPFSNLTYNISSNITARLEKNRTQQELEKNNAELQKKITSLEQKILELKIFIEENNMITSQTTYLQERGFNFINAKIISHSSSPNPNLLLINQGASAGIKEGMAVVIEDGLVVGKILEAQLDTALILLLIDESCSISASLAGHSDIIGLASGQLNLSISLKDILKNSPLESGDLIMTSGFNDHIPAGLLIGEVDQITNNNDGLFKTANLNTSVNFKNLKIVSVVLD